MTAISEIAELRRLEDFVSLAKKGKQVQVAVALRKMVIKHKVHPEETEQSTGEADSYLLRGDYTFKIGDAERKIEKVYVMGSIEESLDMARVNRNIANERLKVDYQRLQDVKIKVEEHYF